MTPSEISEAIGKMRDAEAMARVAPAGPEQDAIREQVRRMWRTVRPFATAEQRQLARVQ